MKHIILKTEKDFEKLNYLPFNRKYHVRNDLTDNMNRFGFSVPIIILESNILQEKNVNGSLMDKIGVRLLNI